MGLAKIDNIEDAPKLDFSWCTPELKLENEDNMKFLLMEKMIKLAKKKDAENSKAKT